MLVHLNSDIKWTFTNVRTSKTLWYLRCEAFCVPIWITNMNFSICMCIQRYLYMLINSSNYYVVLISKKAFIYSLKVHLYSTHCLLLYKIKSTTHPIQFKLNWSQTISSTAVISKKFGAFYLSGFFFIRAIYVWTRTHIIHF